MSESFVDRLRRLRWWLRSALGRDHYYRPTTRIVTSVLGEGPAQWVVAADCLEASSIVYSAGVGANIDFDLDLMERFGATAIPLIWLHPTSPARTRRIPK